MKRLFFLLAFFLYESFAYENQLLKYYIEYGLYCAINENFQIAERVFKNIVDAYPQEPCGYFFLGVVMEAKMMAREDWSALDSLRRLFAYVVDLSKKGYDDPYNLYIRGCALGYLAIIAIREGEYIEALPYIRGSVGSLSKALRMKPELYEAYLPLGGYYYWKSKKLGFLNNILFLEDERDKGLKYLQLASEKGGFVRDIAKHSLILALIEEKRFDEAKALCSYLKMKYPTSSLPLWDALAVAEAQQDYVEIMNITENLIARLRQEKDSNYFNLVEILYRRAIAADKLNWYVEALNAINEIFALELPDETIRRHSYKLRELKALKNRLSRIEK